MSLRQPLDESSRRSEPTLAILLGGGFALALFLLMALAQMMGDVEVPEQGLEETVMAFAPPEIEEFEDEPPPPPEEQEPPPELEKEPPQLSLAQLDIALNPGTGGSLAGDFAMPTISTSAAALGTEDFVDFSDLDQLPRPVGATLDFPRRLKRKAISGRIVLLIKLESDGRVSEARVESSNLPDAYGDFVQREVERWTFTPPTQQGRPVRAKAQLPFPIHIR